MTANVQHSAGGRKLDDLAQIIGAYNQVTQKLQNSHEALRAEVARLQQELVSTDAQGDYWGGRGSGTVPHAIIACFLGDTAAVLGSRTLGGRKIYKYAKNYWGVRGLSAVANLLYGSRLTDIATGLKLVRLDVARSLKLDSSGFDLDFELPCKLLKRGYDIAEVAVAYHPRTVEEGKKLSMPFRTGFRALWVILKTRFWG